MEMLSPLNQKAWGQGCLTLQISAILTARNLRIAESKYPASQLVIHVTSKRHQCVSSHSRPKVPAMQTITAENPMCHRCGASHREGENLFKTILALHGLLRSKRESPNQSSSKKDFRVSAGGQQWGVTFYREQKNVHLIGQRSPEPHISSRLQQCQLWYGWRKRGSGVEFFHLKLESEQTKTTVNEACSLDPLLLLLLH